MQKGDNKIYIGIDPGVNTGVAVMTEGKYIEVKSGKIHEVMAIVKDYKRLGFKLKVVVEDARKRKKFLSFNRNIYQGVGSVKRDCKIWQDFLDYLPVDYEMRHPRNTKISADEFARLCKWPDRTNEHGRDAAMLLYEYYKIRQLV